MQNILGIAMAVNLFFLSAHAITFTTYNTGLAQGFVGHTLSRVDPLIENIKKEAPDVLCLQEVWDQEHQKKFLKQLKKIYPYYQTIQANQKFATKKPACSVGDLVKKDAIGRCLFNQCRSKTGEELTRCVLTDCRESVLKLKKESPICASAFFAQAGQGIVGALYNLLNPFRSIGLFNYQGEAGLLLLSRYPLENRTEFELKDMSTSSRRAALFSDIMVKGKKISLGCTHLTAELSHRVPYTGRFDSWIDESKAQAQAIVELLISKKADFQVLMGDFNCGLKNGDLQDEAPETCQVFTQNNFSDFVTSQDPHCSFCDHNSLVTSKKNTLIDHIFTMRIPEENIRFKYKFQNKVQIKIPSGEVIKTNLSDHFGVEAELSL